MSIGIYAFLRIYFLSFGLSAFAQFRTRCRSDCPGAACLVSSADRCSVSSVWACVSVRGVVCPAACAVQSVRVRLGLESPPLGYMGRAGGGVVAASRRKNSKKGVLSLPPPLFCSKSPHPHCQSQKFHRKTKKTPTKGLRSVLYLPYKP